MGAYSFRAHAQSGRDVDRFLAACDAKENIEFRVRQPLVRQTTLSRRIKHRLVRCREIHVDATGRNLSNSGKQFVRGTGLDDKARGTRRKTLTGNARFRMPRNNHNPWQLTRPPDLPDKVCPTHSLHDKAERQHGG